MSSPNLDEKLLKSYQEIRFKEQAVITDFLTVLPKIPNVDETRISQVRDAMFHSDHPYLMVFLGPFSSGKSSLINALLGEKSLLKIGPTPTTDRIHILRWGEEQQMMASGGEVETVFHPSPLLQKVSFVDTPGLESVFQRHEETTRKFLHRADVVMVVMLATQAMTSKNLEYLQTFREYGKKIIILINQSDLLTKDERNTVQEYVLEQSHSKLGFKPDVWMVSAKVGLQSIQENGKRSNNLWHESGLHKIEDYVDRQLSDTDRLRQKLQTPLQILQNVHASALVAVKDSQSKLDQYRSVSDNVDQQLGIQQQTLLKTVREINSEIDSKFEQTIASSEKAIQSIFRFSRAFNSLFRGIGELSGILRLFRTGSRLSVVESTFTAENVFQPIRELPEVVDKLGPRLEGQDMQNIDDLVKYGHRELQNLPQDVSGKLIGQIQAPVRYDRTALQSISPRLRELETEAQTVEITALDASLRNTLMYLAFWEILMVVFIIALFNFWNAIGAEQPAIPIILLVILLISVFLGFLFVPLRGRMAFTAHANRLHKIQAQYKDVVTEGADAQIEHSMKLRRDTVAPLTQLIEAQVSIHDGQLQKLKDIEQQMTEIESDLTTLGSRKILGLNV